MEGRKNHMEQSVGYKRLVPSSTGRVRGGEQNIRGTSLVEEHRSLGGSIISRLDNGAFVGLI